MDSKPESTPSEIAKQQLAAKKAWRRKQAALPMSEKVEVLEKLRAQSQHFRKVRERRVSKD
jgi:hypothetical protein